LTLAGSWPRPWRRRRDKKARGIMRFPLNELGWVSSG
jgi:hypothetical protein